MESALADIKECVIRLKEKERLYETAKAKHNSRCLKYYHEHKEASKEKRNEYARRYYEKRKANTSLQIIADPL